MQASLVNNYLEHLCCYCNKKKLRRKLKGDWRPGEKLGRGFMPLTYDYYICDNCKRSSIMFRTSPLSIDERRELREHQKELKRMREIKMRKYGIPIQKESGKE